MQRLIPRLSAALLTFALGLAVSVVYSMSRVWSTSELDIPGNEVPIPPVEMSCFPGRSIEAPATAGPSYFPSILAHIESSDQLRRNWYSKHLRAMYELPLYSEDIRFESYRFLWLRSFHRPIAVRIGESGSERFIVVKELSGAGGYEPGELIRTQVRSLTAAEWREFNRRLDNSCYWQLPTIQEDFGLDGAQWILEGHKAGRYHIVDRWSPASGSYHELCLYVLELSGLKFDDPY